MNRIILIFSLVAGMLFSQCACSHASSYGNGGENTIVKTDKPDIPSDRYGKTLSDDIVYANALSIAGGDVGMQCFDILNNGDILACGTRHSALYFQRMTPSGQYREEMKIWYAAHGTNMSVEEDGEDAYVWTSNYSSRLGGEGDYYAEKIISRVRYQPGVTLMPEDCEDNYYVGPYQNLLVCTDTENDNLCILYSSGEVSGKDTKVVVWSLKEAKKVPVTTVNIGTVVRGGGSGPVAEIETISPDVAVHDLSALKPKYSFFINSVELNDGAPMQGFCIYKKRLYWFTGDGSKRTAKVSVITFNGMVELSQQSLAFIDDKAGIVKLGSKSGYFEAEGIKIRKGILYTGYLWGPTGNWKLTILNN